MIFSSAKYAHSSSSTLGRDEWSMLPPPDILALAQLPQLEAWVAAISMG